MRGSRALLAGGAAACLVLAVLARRAAIAPPIEGDGPETALGISIAAPFGLAMQPGDALTIRGALRTSFDGTSYDAVTRQVGEVDAAGASHAVVREGGLFAIAGSGLDLVEQHPNTHVYRVVANGADAPACRAAGVSAPCLVPRTMLLAHERLLSEEEFARTLTGTIAAAIPPPPAAPPSAWAALSSALLLLSALLSAAFAWIVQRARRASPIGQVYAAAREAERRCHKKDPTLLPLHARIAPLVRRAEELEVARRACEDKLAAIDRPALERKRAAWTAAKDAQAKEALAWVAAECAEADRLRADRDASVAGLVRVASALRVLALCARKHRDVRVRVLADDPVDTMASEIALRDEAIAEAEHLSARP